MCYDRAVRKPRYVGVSFCVQEEAAMIQQEPNYRVIDTGSAKKMETELTTLTSEGWELLEFRVTGNPSGWWPRPHFVALLRKQR